MSRKGDGWDNAVVESFFATLKTEALDDRVLDDRVPDDHDAATRAIGHSIDGDYNTKRRHSFIRFQSPIQFELKTQLAAMSASSTCPSAGGKFSTSCARRTGMRARRARDHAS